VLVAVVVAQMLVELQHLELQILAVVAVVVVLAILAHQVAQA
jgi:hypothetical protein